MSGTVKRTAKKSVNACEYERKSVLACEGEGAPVRSGGGGLGRGAYSPREMENANRSHLPSSPSSLG